MSVRAEAARHRSPFATLIERAIHILTHPAFFIAELVFHLAWIGLNAGLVPGLAPWDPYPFQLLALVASAQAFLFALLILMHQDREARIAELREETDLQVALHAERETTKLLRLMAELHVALGIRSAEHDEELDEMVYPLDPRQLRESLQERLREAEE